MEILLIQGSVQNITDIGRNCFEILNYLFFELVEGSYETNILM